MEPEIGSSPSQEIKTRLPQWRSSYNPVALKTLEKVLPRRIKLVHPEATSEYIKDQVLQKREKLKRYLDAVDREVVRNFGVFESEKDPGVRFPYAKVLLRNVASEVQNSPINPETEKDPDKIVVVFAPFTPPPGGGPDKWVDGIDTYEKSVASQMRAY